MSYPSLHRFIHRWSRSLAAFGPWLLGLFVLWQLVFPILANLFEFVPIRPTEGDLNPPLESTQTWGRFTESDTLQSVADDIGHGLGRYAQFTGQEQSWDMFTPGFPPQTVIPFVEIRFDDARIERVHSRFDPIIHRHSWMRLPFRYDREFNYEANLFMLVWHYDPQRPPEHPDQIDLVIKVRANGELISAYLRSVAKKHPAAVEIRLMFRSIPLIRTKPETEWLIARYRPRVLPAKGMMVLEAFDPQTRTFVPLERWDD